MKAPNDNHFPAVLSDEGLSSGLYAISEAAKIIGVPTARVRRWVADYTHRPEKAPLLTPRLDPYILTFAELVELLFVKQFLDAGVSMHTIRRAAGEAARRFETPYPFAMQRFDTDGSRIFATLHGQESDRTVLEDIVRSQYAFDELVRPFFKQLDFTINAEALRYWPFGRGGHVVLDAERAFGAPIDPATGVPSYVLAAAVSANPDQAYGEIAVWFDVAPEAIEAAVRFEQGNAAA